MRRTPVVKEQVDEDKPRKETKNNQKRHEMLRVQPFLPYSVHPELRIFLIGTDPYREPM